MIIAASALSSMLGHFIIVTGAFILLFILLRLFAWSKITGIFEKRASHISSEIDRAEKAKAEATDLVNQRQEALAEVRKVADGILLEAKQTGESMKKRMVADAEKQVDDMKAKAERDIERNRAEAMASMRDEVSAMSLDLAQQILMKELDPEGQSDLIDRYLAKLGE
ncbi:F0F1 ATP synthase subunit B [Streptococcus moroccensis]|uniref:ATP synthase subunit b n=1 Tax=Streptococcus moroccensis TaxID=1451356 RepID=A0ABT9YPH2_9STRE|nr:F0F1 ATP synthase subunit B [Streptococcus moroccensis]MDQ0221893.1 F-type H+-transporting ATPase subunit b [Streptococcus moroccensis]